MGIEEFVRKVWGSPEGASYIFLSEKGHSKEDVNQMFETGTIVEKISEYSEKMSPDERYGFWSMNG